MFDTLPFCCGLEPPCYGKRNAQLEPISMFHKQCQLFAGLRTLIPSVLFQDRRHLQHRDLLKKERKCKE